jgi:hypothetical protein
MDFGKRAQAGRRDERQGGDDGDHETKGAEAEEAQAEEIVIPAAVIIPDAASCPIIDRLRNSWCFESMPRFFFDLFFDRYVVLDPGGMLFEIPAKATAAADVMAQHLMTSRADLRCCGGWIRVRDERRKVVYRSSIAADSTGGDAP